jgi:glycosyltransferase involved in cell wall biosynthesis
MRIVLDTNCLYTTQAGTARYTRGLLAGFSRLSRTSLQVSELCWPVENFGYRQPQRAIKTLYRELIWCRREAARQLRDSNCDLLHTTTHLNFAMPASMHRVHTLYDLVILRHPEKFRPWQRFSGRRSLRLLTNMERIICISRFTADEAIRLLGLPATKLEVVHCGNDLALEPMDAEQSFKNGVCRSMPETFFLFVGSLEPGKNLRLLQDVYHYAVENGVSLPHLVIVGARWEGVQREGTAPASWHYLGRVDDTVLVALYRRARALLFPSKYEGFGLPVLEAMSLGCPVICSRAGSLPEVGGDAVVYADLNVGSFLDAMRSILTDVVQRQELVAAGLERARMFSWKRCAEETIAIYRDVLGR